MGLYPSGRHNKHSIGMKYMKYIKLGSALLITGVFAIFYFPFKCTLLGFRWITDIMEDFDNQITIWIKKIK